MIVKTNDYLKKIQSSDGDDDMNDENRSINYLMMFQLIGVPSLNQKAREVPPFYESLTTSGIYLLLSGSDAYFWIG